MRVFYDQYQFNVSRSPLYEDCSALPTSPLQGGPVKLIAYYLPQFHPVPENDAWWGHGFTDWTNVTKALPRYLGHQQPRMPADLGFYDLRQAGTLHRQADFARRAGIYGFCIHHYWFGGRQILEAPLQVLLANPDIDLRFCLNWANENWTRRWDGRDREILLEQRYGPKYDVRYMESILPALMDPRYIRIDGRPLVMIYRPELLPEARRSVERWRSLLIRNGVANPYLVMVQAFGDNDPRPYGMDAAAGYPPHNGGWDLPNERIAVRRLDPCFQGKVSSYDALVRRMLKNQSTEYKLFPGVCPSWDNEARRPGSGFSFYGSTPPAYGTWLRDAARLAKTASLPDERLVFINAWNEWAEGAHLEPDRHFGCAYLAETRRTMESLETGVEVPCPSGDGRALPSLMHPRPSIRNFVSNFPYELRRRARRALSRR
jgi:lipopolysaccharide biosynthesis protein